jgi:hypothetical protein
MAGHLPVKKSGFPRVIVNSFKMEHVKRLPILEWVKVIGVDVMRLPVDDYEMNEEHGKVDEEVLSYKWKGETYEMHLAKDMTINEVYLVK